ncbi:MAG: glycosyltransferase [Planctomycetota bacterium]|nr:MAG: glycosyltransferase [Planctomycetota bacterium]
MTTIGTTCSRKDQGTLARALAILKKQKRDDLHCYMVGLRESLAYAGEIKRISQENRLQRVVTLVPETDDVYPYFRASDVFVSCSHVEAFSRTILEAEAFGLPILTTPCCGINEQVRDGMNALLFDMSDAAGLARLLAALLDDEEGRRQLAWNSRKVFECLLTYDEMLERYERLILGAYFRGPLPS